MTTTNNTLTGTAHTIHTKLRDQQTAYRNDAKEAARQGYRPHYCIHGTNNWTDYDNICEGCEDGEFTQYTTPLELRALALRIAKNNIQRDHRRAEIAADFMRRYHEKCGLTYEDIADTVLDTIY